MGEASTRNAILYLAASCIYVPRKSLSVLGCSDSFLSRALRSAQERGFVTKSTITERVRYRDSKEEFYQITGEGLRYLSEKRKKLPDDMRWIGAFYQEFKNFGWLRERALRGTPQMSRFLSVTTSAVFCAAAGCRVPLVLPLGQRFKCGEIEIAAADDDILFFVNEGEDKLEGSRDERNTLSDEMLKFLESKEGKEQNPNGILMNRDSDVVFTDVFEMKRKLHGEFGRHGHYTGGRFTGIVESPLKSVLVYEGKREGMSWAKWITDLDLRTYRTYVSRISKRISYQPGRESGVMLVKNAKMFADLVLNKYGKKQKGEKFGKGFSSFMFFPISEAGAKQFSEYIRSDLSEHYEKVISDAIESQMFMKNESTYQRYFPLATQDGVRLMIGTFLDGVKIQKILDIQTADPFPFGIICFAWQQDYFSRIFPDAFFFIIS